MRKRFLLLSICLLTTLGMMAKGNGSRQLFDFGWTFTQNGKTVSVDLPHDWDIYDGPHSGKGATGTGGGWSTNMPKYSLTDRRLDSMHTAIPRLPLI